MAVAIESLFAARPHLTTTTASINDSKGNVETSTHTSHNTHSTLKHTEHPFFICVPRTGKVARASVVSTHQRGHVCVWLSPSLRTTEAIHCCIRCIAYTYLASVP